MATVQGVNGHLHITEVETAATFSITLMLPAAVRGSGQATLTVYNGAEKLFTIVDENPMFFRDDEDMLDVEEGQYTHILEMTFFRDYDDMLEIKAGQYTHILELPNGMQISDKFEVVEEVEFIG